MRFGKSSSPLTFDLMGEEELSLQQKQQGSDN